MVLQNKVSEDDEVSGTTLWAMARASRFTAEDAKAIAVACERFSRVSKKSDWPLTPSLPLHPKKQRQGRARKIKIWNNQRRGEGKR